MKKAIVIGATGLVGSELIQLLIHDEYFTGIVSLVRRASGITDPKLTERIINFDEPATWKKHVTGDVLFSALGTTIALAKTKEEQYKVDFTYQFTVAKIAAQNGVTHYVLVSAAGASSTAKPFYMKMKGELEKAVQSLPFDTISIIRPGLLAGKRTQSRAGEKIGFAILTALNALGLFKRYKPIPAQKVAMAMIKAMKKKKSSSYTLDEVFELAE